jgi:phospholipase/carboxylesterase
MTIQHRARPAAGEPEGLLVLFHGRGADEHDLFPLLDLLDPERRLLGVTPRGPLSLPPGGAHWYAVREIGYPDPSTFLPTYGTVAEWLDGLAEETAIGPERTVLGGFSQGAVMALALALGAGRPTPAAVLALSGFVPAVDGWTADVERPGLAAFVTHGRRDPVIPVEFGRATRDLLEPSPVDVTYVETDAAHHVDPRTLAELPAWLERKVVLAAPQD